MAKIFCKGLMEKLSIYLPDMSGEDGRAVLYDLELQGQPFDAG